MRITDVRYTREFISHDQETTLKKEKYSRLFWANAAICTERKRVLYLNKKELLNTRRVLYSRIQFF